MCQRTSGEKDSSRGVDGERDSGRLNVLYHFPLPLSFGHSVRCAPINCYDCHFHPFFKKKYRLGRKKKRFFFPWKRSYIGQINVLWWLVFFSNAAFLWTPWEWGKNLSFTSSTWSSMQRACKYTSKSVLSDAQKVLTIFPVTGCNFSQLLVLLPRSHFAAVTVCISYELCESWEKSTVFCKKIKMQFPVNRQAKYIVWGSCVKSS